MYVKHEKSLVLIYYFLRDSSPLALQNVSGIMDTKLLGIYLTQDLKWGKQTQEMIKRANLGILSLNFVLLTVSQPPTYYVFFLHLSDRG